MADRRFAEEAAATDLCDDSRVPRERHKKRMLDHHNSHIMHNNNNNNKNNNKNSLDVNDTTSSSNLGSCGDGDDSEISCCSSDDCHCHHPIFDMGYNEIANLFKDSTTKTTKTLDENSVAKSECDIIKNVFNERKNKKKPVMVNFSDSIDCDEDDGDDGDNDDDDDDDDDDVDVDFKSKATVVDSAAAAVAVSAIPEAIKDMKIKKLTSSTIKCNNKSIKRRCDNNDDEDDDDDDDDVVAMLATSYKGKIRSTNDSLVGPCGKKRCADRYDSSESSDSGVAVSCGECSSSGTSDITEPGSPCSTSSSDEGVAINRAKSKSPLPSLPSLPKLAPPTTSTHNGTRPQWPWTPPLAATACTTNYKNNTTKNNEPEIGTLPKTGAADPSARINNNKTSKLQNHHDTQGKITEYFKTQIKPQQPKIKKTSTEMSVLIAKNSPEFRRPQTVQRNKNGLAKYLNVVLPNSRRIDNWNVKKLSSSSPSSSPTTTTTTTTTTATTKTFTPPPPPPPTPATTTTISSINVKKLTTASTPRVTVTKLDKKLISKALPGLPLSSDVLSSITGCKISSLRLTNEASPKATIIEPSSTPTVVVNNNNNNNNSSNNNNNEPVGIDFTSFYKKTVVNENNNITSTNHARTNGQQNPLSRLPSEIINTTTPTTTSRRLDDDDEEEEEDESSRSSESKPSSISPILTAPTTIRFPARVPTKNNRTTNDSGICRWDKCDINFECNITLLEHLQNAHINSQTGGDNFVCQWQGCKVQGRSSCSRRWLERHVLSHGGNKPFRCIVDGCGSSFNSQPALERHVNNHFNQSETSSSSSRRSCENGKLVRRNGKKLRYRRQPWSARLFDYIDTGVMEGLQHRLLEIAKTRTQGKLAETPGDSIALTSQIIAKRVEMDGKTKVLLRWYPRDIEPDEWVAESQVQTTKNINIKKAASVSTDEMSLILHPALHGGKPSSIRIKQRRKPVKNS